MNAPINEAVADTVDRELGHLQNIVGLCAFAVEARRILAEIDLAASADDAVDEQLSTRVNARCNWGEMPDTLAYVLIDVQERLANLGNSLSIQPTASGQND